jgi:hypothetical protein
MRTSPGTGERWRRIADRSEDGHTAILTLVVLSFFFVIGLIAVNSVMIFAARASAQRAADAAALAACLELPDAARADSSATQYGASAGGLNADGDDGLESGRGDQTAVSSVSTTGAASQRPGAGTLANDEVRVDVSRTQGLIGAPSAGFTDQPVGAFAVCRRDEGSYPALLALGNGSGTLRIDGADVEVPRAGVVANSTDPSALQVTNGGSGTAKYIETGSGAAQGGGLEPPPSSGTFADPYAAVTDPPLTGSSASPPNCPSGTAGAGTPRCTISSGTTANPGIYWGGLRIRVSLTLNPGTYHIAGGDLEIDGGVELNGTDVTFFIGPNDLGYCGTSHNFHAGDNARLLITPPSEGNLRDLIIYRSRACSTNATVEFHPGVTIGPPGGPYGAVYVPTARVLIGDGGAPSARVNAITVASRIHVWGPAIFADLFIPAGDVRHGDIQLVE